MPVDRLSLNTELGGTISDQTSHLAADKNLARVAMIQEWCYDSPFIIPVPFGALIQILFQYQKKLGNRQRHGLRIPSRQRQLELLQPHRIRLSWRFDQIYDHHSIVRFINVNGPYHGREHR